MNDIELRIRVAEAMGWTDIGSEVKRGWVGRPPDRLGYHPIPNWDEDLPACMTPGGPWEWLRQQFRWTGFSLAWMPDVCEFDGWFKPAHLGGGPSDRVYARASTEALTICHAVLAVAAKLKDVGDD